MERKWGYIHSEEDSRDYKFSTISKARSLKESVDLRKNMSAVEDQKDIGSCVANANVGALEYLHARRMARRWFCKDDTTRDYSRLYNYWFGRDIGRYSDPTIDSGMSIRNSIKALDLYGIPKEKYWPYDTEKWSVKPSQKAQKKAKLRTVSDYYRIDNPGQILEALSRELPVTFGFQVPVSFMSQQVADTGMFEMPEPNERTIGGHAVLACGYDTTKDLVLVRNSWGADWGQGGYVWMPFKFFDPISYDAHVNEVWVIRSHPSE